MEHEFGIRVVFVCFFKVVIHEWCIRVLFVCVCKVVSVLVNTNGKHSCVFVFDSCFARSGVLSSFHIVRLISRV